MDFIKKHLPDKFFLEDKNRVSLRNIIAREIVSNTLMHREYTSSYAAKLVIRKDQMYPENISLMSVKRLMKALQDNGMIERIGSNRKGYWKITKKDGHSNRIQPQEMLIFPGFLFHV